METASEVEVERIKEVYRLREEACLSKRYIFTDPMVLMSSQELERVLARWILKCKIRPLTTRRVLEIGCGDGNNLLNLLRIGFSPDCLFGNELMSNRMKTARSRLPTSVNLLEGNALELQFPDGFFDVVFQAVVFSSILDDSFQTDLAACMWRWEKPGGGVLWYDFTYDYPHNPDVKGVGLQRIRQLFPHGRMRYWRVTLAPPISRIITRVHPCLYTLFNALPALRTHVLCWIQKNKI